MAFYGTVIAGCSDSNYKEAFLAGIKLYRNKSKVGTIQRVVNEREVIVEDFFGSKLSNREVFIGMSVVCSTGQMGRIESTFGKTSKVKIVLDKKLSLEDMSSFRDIKVTVEFKKLLFSDNKRIFQ